MERKAKRFLAGILAAGLCISIAGCGQKESLVYLNYGTGISEDGNYNKELYGINTVQPQGSDPTCIYVSEEEDPDYGGYYYMYTGGPGKCSEYQQEHISFATAYCFRSRDLFQWEICGVKDGFSLIVDEEDWCQENLWAPAVIRNPADGKYYMYFSAGVPQNYGVEGISSSDYDWDRLHLGVAVSDTPIGPFDVLYDTDSATGKRIPTINFHTGCGTEYPWSAIDAAPFIDDDGTLYLYFNKHADEHYTELNGIVGMKMKSMTIPDYSTVTYLTQGDYATCSSTPGNIEEVTEGEKFEFDELGLNEAPHMYKHNGVYYLTYSANGYTYASYPVHQAISDAPLGKFVKPGAAAGNPVCDGSLLGNVNGTGSHTLVERDGELWIVYHRHGSINGYDEGLERSIGAERVNLVENMDGQIVLSANGPSLSLQWLPEGVSGYKNRAQTAEISISAGTGIEYLTDGILPYYQVTEGYMMSAEGDVTVTMKWKEPVSVRSVMIYNAKEAEKAFSKISDIRFKLAEQPSWASKAYDYAVIKDVVLPDRYWDVEIEKYEAFAPAVAEFEDMMITELVITIKEGDRLMEVDKFGDPNTGLNLSEIVVLGKEGKHE